MKSIIILSLICFVQIAGVAQQKDITVFEKKEGEKNIVMARNTGKVPYMVSVNITSTGMEVKPSMKVEAIIPPGFIKEMATLVPRAGESWSYSFEVSFMEHIGQDTKSPSNSDQQGKAGSDKAAATSPSSDVSGLSDAPIMVYTKAGCGRCVTVKKEMNERGIAYEEINIQNPSPEVNHMWTQLRDSGFTGSSVTLPVVRVNGKYHYNIKDLMGFVSNLKS